MCFGSRTFVPVSWMCKKQTSVSHSSTGSEIIFWMPNYVWMGYLLLIFGTVIEVLRSSNNTVQPKHISIQETGATLDSKTKTPNVRRKQKVEQVKAHKHTFFSR